MTHNQDTQTTNLTRRGVIATIGTAAVATLPGVSAANEDSVDALFEDPTLGNRAVGGLYFVLGFASAARNRISFGEDHTAEIDRLVEETVEEFASHREEWLTYVNSRGLGGADHQSLHLTFEYADERRERYVIADWDSTSEEYESVHVETEGSDSDIEATLRDDAVENAADELAELHDRYIAPNQDVERSYISKLAGRYYFGSDHVTVSLLGGE